VVFNQSGVSRKPAIPQRRMKTENAIVRGQFVKTTSGKVIAVRIFHSPSSSIEAGKSIRPLPEFGAIAYNFELFDGREVLWFKLRKPESVHGIKATVRAEVWNTRAGELKRLAERWYARRTPKGFESFAHFVKAFLESEQKQRQNELVAKMPNTTPETISTKPLRRGEQETRIDHRENAMGVTLDLLKREYPNFFNAREKHLSDEEQRKAYVADLRAIHGVFPDVEGCASLWSDTRFNEWLGKAMTTPGHKVTREEWALAQGWIPGGYYRMTDAELKKALNERTGLNLKGGSWRRKAQRMGLLNALRPGRPENPNELPAPR